MRLRQLTARTAVSALFLVTASVACFGWGLSQPSGDGRLPETGAMDVVPYVIAGGVAMLLGALLVVFRHRPEYVDVDISEAGNEPDEDSPAPAEVMAGAAAPEGGADDEPDGPDAPQS